MKESPRQLPGVKEKPKGSGEMQVPRLKEGSKPRSLPSPPHNKMVDPGPLQQTYNNPGSSTCQAQGTSRLSNAWVRLETDSSLKSEDFSTKEETVRSKVFAPQTPAPMDGWICVERPPIPPPMTWEDALKVAQKAREAVVDAKFKIGTSPLTCLPEPNSNANPMTSQTFRAINSSPEILSEQGAVFSPLPPKQSPSRISRGRVKARINAFESSVLQGPDPSMPKLEKTEKGRSETTPPAIDFAARGKRKASPEELKKWEDKQKNNSQQSPRDTGDREECRNANQDPEKESSRQDLPSDSNAKDQEPRLRDGCQSSRLNKPTAVGRSDLKVNGNLTMQGESRQTRTAYRLPELQDINVEALDNQLIQNLVTKEEFVSAVEGRHSQTPKEEGGSSLDQVNWRLDSHVRAMEELGGKEEGKAVAAKRPISVEKKAADKTKHHVAFQDSKATPEKHAEPHKCNKVRRPRNSLAGPNQAPSDKQKPSSPGGSLQAWKDLQDSLEQKARKSFFMKRGLNENFEKTDAYRDRVTSKSTDDPFAAAAARQVDIFMKEKSDTVLERQQSPPVGPASCEDTSYKTGGDVVTTANDKKIPSHLGSGVKQVLSGAVLLAGLFALWPRNGDPVERYHVVKAGETLSSIAPGQCTDPSSHFCRINPRVCDQKTIYPGQRIRLS